MKTITLYVKNMVCNRCNKIVKEELTKLDLTVKSIELGKVEIIGLITSDKLAQIKSKLIENEFELIEDKKKFIIDRIKTTIIEIIHHKKIIQEQFNFSENISKLLKYDYSYLSNLFSKSEGITIEKYIIKQKIEKAKELIKYNELSLSEIAYQLGYSSSQYFTNQFKKITKLTPSAYKKSKNTNRIALDKV